MEKGRTKTLPGIRKPVPAAFKRNDFLNQFADVAAKYRIPEGLLELELTESIFFDDNSIAMVRESINRMHELGFKCSLDDFGSGFSSLGLLKEFDVDTIKLDRRFFLDMSKPKAEDVVECLIDLACLLYTSRCV